MGFDPSKMDVIDRRRIEAMVLGPMLGAFQVEFGVEKTNEIATIKTPGADTGRWKSILSKAIPNDIHSM